MVGRATIITADWRSETSAMITENERKNDVKSLIEIALDHDFMQ